MSPTDGIALLSVVISALVAGTTLAWFIYRRGMAAGEAAANSKAVERQMAEMRALLEKTQAKVAELESGRTRPTAKRGHTITAS